MAECLAPQRARIDPFPPGCLVCLSVRQRRRRRKSEESQERTLLLPGTSEWWLSARVREGMATSDDRLPSYVAEWK